MSRWFRFYADAMRNPKVMRLSDKDYRLWTKLLAVASENDGHIPEIAVLKSLLSMRYDHLRQGLSTLISGGLIDALADGYEPYHWDKFQYKSDTSTDRVTKHRAKGNVSVTPPDTDTETEKIPVDKSTGELPLEIDPAKVMFDTGKSLLIGAGVKASNAGAMLGKWRRDNGDESLMAAIGKCKREGAIDPVAFIQGCFRAKQRDGPALTPHSLGMTVPC